MWASSPPGKPKPALTLLEHDYRFGVFSEFLFYDFMQPVKLPGKPFMSSLAPLIHPSSPQAQRMGASKADLETCTASLKGSVDRIICDPPFLSDDCQTKMALTVRWMAKPAADVRVIISTGERMENLVTKLYRGFGIKTTDYEPAQGLSNEFFCYANFDSEAWNWRPDIKDR